MGGGITCLSITHSCRVASVRHSSLLVTSAVLSKIRYIHDLTRPHQNQGLTHKPHPPWRTHSFLGAEKPQEHGEAIRELHAREVTCAVEKTQHCGMEAYISGVTFKQCDPGRTVERPLSLLVVPVMGETLRTTQNVRLRSGGKDINRLSHWSCSSVTSLG